MTAGAPPYGLDHWTFRDQRHPKDSAWRRAALTEPEVGLRAAGWSDEPFDLHNATAAAHQLCDCAVHAAGRLL